MGVELGRLRSVADHVDALKIPAAIAGIRKRRKIAKKRRLGN